jgi:hypothetical protein
MEAEAISFCFAFNLRDDDMLICCLIIVQENPLCELIPMKNNDKAYVWACNDFSEGEAAVETFALRLQNLESKENITTRRVCLMLLHCRC